MRTFACLAAGAVVALSAAACSHAESPSREAAPAPVPVSIAVVASETLPDTFETGGSVRARVVATIVAKIMAEVQSVAVVPGQAVQAGQTLVRLDARDLEASHARAVAAETAATYGLAGAEAERQSAAAGLNLAKVTFQRFSDLRARNSATQHELDEVTAALRAAESRLAGAEARVAEARGGIEAAGAAARAAAVALSYATIQAPFAGVVTEKRVEVGNMASPGQPLLTIEDTQRFLVETRVDASRAGFVSLGQEVTVLVDQAAAPGARAVGRVSEIARVLDPGSHDFLVKIELPASALPLRSGMYARVLLSGPVHQGLAVPATALVRRGQVTFVFVVESDGRAHLRMVNAAEPIGDRAEIRAGLSSGERVVIAPSPVLTDGTPVVAGGSRPEAR